jgi:hypothetical protein
METAQHDFRAWYEPGGGGRAKIVVAGTVTEIDGSESTLVPAKSEDGDPRVLRLAVVGRPHPGFARPHVAFKREIRYEAPAKPGEFTEIRIQGKSGTIMKIRIEAPHR